MLTAVKMTHGLTTQMRTLSIKPPLEVPVWLIHGRTTWMIPLLFLLSINSPTGYDSFINCSNEEPALMGPKVLSAPSRKPGTDVTASTAKEVHQVYCFLCKKRILHKMN